ncbi:MAG: sugar nucleotide-binding protein [Planctomycetota bacterium]
MPHAVIIGGDSTIGQALAREAHRRGVSLLRTSRRDSADPDIINLDLSDVSAIDALSMPSPPCRVYVLAAATSLRVCEEHPRETARVNVDAVTRLAHRAAAIGATPVMVSTNLVFDGTQAKVSAEAAPNPKTAYGQQKARAERAVREVDGVVIRPTKVLPPEPPLLAGWREALRRGERVQAFTDLWFAPVPITALVNSLLEANPGIHHLSGKHDMSYYEAALHIAQRVDADPGLVVPAKAADAGIPAAQRPRHTTLHCDQPFDPWEVLDDALSLKP